MTYETETVKGKLFEDKTFSFPFAFIMKTPMPEASSIMPITSDMPNAPAPNIYAILA